MLGIFLWDGSHCKNLHFLITFFNFPLETWWRGFQSLLVLWKLAPDWNQRISKACFQVFSTACLALMALERVRSDSIKSLSQKALPFVPQSIISFMRESQRFSNSHSVLNFFSSEIVKTLAFKLSIREKVMAQNGDIFPWVSLLRKFIQNWF